VCAKEKEHRMENYKGYNCLSELKSVDILNILDERGLAWRRKLQVLWV
jgi:hypothetical protein